MTYLLISKEELQAAIRSEVMELIDTETTIDYWDTVDRTCASMYTEATETAVVVEKKAIVRLDKEYESGNETTVVDCWVEVTP